VRLAGDGTPIAVRKARNITRTPLGDDRGLMVRDATAVFATVAFDRIQGVSVLNLAGIERENKPDRWLDRLLLLVSSVQSTGSTRGLGRTDLVFSVPAEQAALALERDRLRVDFGDESRGLVYDLALRRLRGTDGAQAFHAKAVQRVYRPKPVVFWAVDTVREEVGPRPIAWLENKVFGARDRLRRAAYALSAPSAQIRDDADELVATAVLDASRLAHDDEGWPPPPVPSLWTTPEPSEGKWEPVDYTFLKPVPGLDPQAKKLPPYFYRTYIRPDSERPYSKVLLIAMDMRQLELGMQAGFEDPQPTAGPPGEGRLPDDSSILERVVGTFNGAFKTTHGEYGMMVNERVLVPPVEGAATVVLTDSGSVGLGNWPKSDSIPESIVSFRQNLDPLVEDGRVNPSGRFVWGWQIEGTSVMTQRTALCVTPAGHLFYAFGSEIDGPTLAKALRQAGCSYGIHLDMNPGHCGFVFTDITDARRGLVEAKVADPEMKMPPTRFVTWSAKDFFYVMLRDPNPRDALGVHWTPEGGSQPPPGSLPGIFTAQLRMGPLDIDLMSFERGRVTWRVGQGQLEPAAAQERDLPGALAEDDLHRVLAAVGLGHATTAARHGLVVRGRSVLPVRSSHATLVATQDGELTIVRPLERFELTPDTHAVQLPMLADGGELTSHGRAHGPVRQRGAVCVTPGGRVLFAYARHDSSDAIASVLLRAGCSTVLELDRGSHHPAFVHRSGSETPPISEYETSVLYAVGKPMRPNAFRWRHEKAAPCSKPTNPEPRVREQGDAGSASSPKLTTK
jgi:hypothetical protein